MNLSVRVCVCLSVTDETHFRNVYSGNEAATYTVTRTLGTSLLTERRREMAGQLHSHSYRRATKAGQATLGQAKTVLSTSHKLPRRFFLCVKLVFSSITYNLPVSFCLTL